MNTPTERAGDLVIHQGGYAFVQDGATGQVDVIIGPTKVSLAETDRPVRYDSRTGNYTRVTNSEAITPVVTASEGQYLVLTNPAADNRHPSGKGKVVTETLQTGKKLNIAGPTSFALYPGQVCSVIEGHQLKYNEYLIIRVYDQTEAVKKWDGIKACLKVAGTGDDKSKAIYAKADDVTLGSLFIVRGVDTSFFIPETGVEVLKDELGYYVRQAVTLETLEYCVLLDQNGEKRYVKGPEVVFPNPTETFVTSVDSKKHTSVELNENMGIYVKVIQDYTENGKEYKSGDELFITGKEMKIYYPRTEHAIIKYGNQIQHYAIALPEGEGRYVLDKDNGNVSIVKGPKMLLPNPIKQVVVRRVLSEKVVDLWFPGNNEAKQVNKQLEETLRDSGEEFVSSFANQSRSFLSASVKSRSALYDSSIDSMQRGTTYTKPRTITLDNKYEGVVMLNIWPGYAVQTVSKNGKRDVVKGPQIIHLEYDQTLEVLELSTGKPKTDNTLYRTAYLQTQNNIVSDIIEAVTSDQVQVSIRLSYRVNFTEGKEEKWFSVSNYVKLLTQHLRSVVRNAIKKTTLENFNEKSTDIIRDTVLGNVVEGKRPGKSFDENGMVVYDVEVLNVQINDSAVSRLLMDTNHKIVENNLKLTEKKSTATFLAEQEKLEQQILTAKDETARIRSDYELVTSKRKLAEEAEEKNLLITIEANRQLVHDATLKRSKEISDYELAKATTQSETRIKEAKEKLAAITPGLIEAAITLGGLGLADTLAKNIKQQTGGLATLFGGESGFDGLIASVKGTPLEDKIQDIIAAFKGQRENRKISAKESVSKD